MPGNNLTVPERLTRIETISTEIKDLVKDHHQDYVQLRKDHDALSQSVTVRNTIQEDRANQVDQRLVRLRNRSAVLGVCATVILAGWKFLAE